MRQGKSAGSEFMRAASLVVALLLATVQASSAGAGEQLLKGCLAIKGHEKTFHRTTIEWRGNPGGQTIVAYALIDVEGRATVCGLHMSRGKVPSSVLERFLAGSQVMSGQQILIKNLSYFPDACGAAGCKLCAPCKMTEVDWQPAFARVRPKLVTRGNLPRQQD